MFHRSRSITPSIREMRTTTVVVIAECVVSIRANGLNAVRFCRRLTGRESVEYFPSPFHMGRGTHGNGSIARPCSETSLAAWLYGSGESRTALPCQDVFVRTLSSVSRCIQAGVRVPFRNGNLFPCPWRTSPSEVCYCRRENPWMETQKSKGLMCSSLPRLNKDREHFAVYGPPISTLPPSR